MIIAIILSLGIQLPADTVAMSLDDAIAHAVLHNPGLRAQQATARAAGQDRLEATRAFLPTLRADVQAIRTTDPVGVFGVKLRQASFAQNDLALPALNDPSPLSGFSTSLTVEVPLLSPEGLFGYSAATHAARAGEAGVARAREATTFTVERDYWDTQLAALRVALLDTALIAASGHARQAEALHDQGLVTGLDARMAGLHRAELEVRRLAAAAEAANARDRLSALLALPHGTALRLTETVDAAAFFTQAGRGPNRQSEDALLERSDLQAFRSGVDAARAAHRSARAAQFPQLFAFGSVVQHAADAPWASGSGDWALGVGIRWNVFPGLSGIAAVRRSEAERNAASARYEDATRQARVEVKETQRMLAAALEGLAVAERANGEARVALEQARLRYRTGQSPVTELLDVQSAATEASLRFVTARRDVLVADAAVRFAQGVDTSRDEVQAESRTDVQGENR